MAIETKRLILRDIVPSDASNMLLLASDPQITQYMDYFDFTDLQGATDWVSAYMAYNSQTPKSSHNMIIEQKDTNAYVGWIGYGQANDRTKGDLDFGYAILKDFWGHGIASEALRAVIDLAWQETSATKIFGECDVQNPASAKVMEKSGMHLEGEFEKDGKKSLRYSTVRPNSQ